MDDYQKEYLNADLVKLNLEKIFEDNIFSFNLYVT